MFSSKLARQHEQALQNPGIRQIDRRVKFKIDPLGFTMKASNVRSCMLLLSLKVLVNQSLLFWLLLWIGKAKINYICKIFKK